MVMNPRTHPRGAAPDFALPRPNPNPDRMTDALWWLVCMCELLEPPSLNGGTYANKPGSHNIGNNLPDYGEGDPRTDHSIRHAWNRTGPWWKTKTAGRDWTFPDAQAGNFATINRYTRRMINAMRDPDDTRPDRALFYVLGQTDTDRVVEGYNELDNENETSGDLSHLWHIHESWFRSAVGSYAEMWKILTVYMGWTFAEWQRSVTEESMALTDPDLLAVRTQVALGIYDALWVASNERDLPDGRLRYSGPGSIGQSIRGNLGGLASAPAIAALSALDAVDEVALANALAPAIADAVVAGLPEDTDDITVDELAEAIRSLIVPPAPSQPEEPPA